MKNIAITFLLLSSLWINAQDTTNDNFSWLLGAWQRTNNQPGKVTTESWGITPNQELKGIGVTLRGQDTVFYEHMSIATIKNELYLVVSTPQHEDAVHFKITSKSKTSFTAENPENNFPKKIIYRKTEQGIKATISGGGNIVDFLFEKAKTNNTRF